jgi:hypothetical protein
MILPLALIPYLLLFAGGDWLGGKASPSLGPVLGIALAAAWAVLRHVMKDSHRQAQQAQHLWLQQELGELEERRAADTSLDPRPESYGHAHALAALLKEPT